MPVTKGGSGRYHFSFAPDRGLHIAKNPGAQKPEKGRFHARDHRSATIPFAVCLRFCCNRAGRKSPCPTPPTTTKDLSDPAILPYYMTEFKVKPGTKRSYRRLKTPIADIAAFNTLVRSLVFNNPLGCTSYNAHLRTYPPIQKVREMYTAKFEYRNEKGKRIGTTIEMYDSVEGYETGISAVIANVANREAHRGKVKRLPAADLFSVMLKCHDPGGDLYYLNIARDRITLTSYSDDAIRERVEAWAGSVPELA